MTSDKNYLCDLIELQVGMQEQGLICTIIDPDNSFKVQFKKANRLEADFVVIYGEDEVKQGIYSVKDMKTGKQETVPVDKMETLLTLIANQQ